jgi:hypothetical protein
LRYRKFFNSIYSIEGEEERNKATKEALEKVTFLTMEILSKSIEYVETPNNSVDDTAFILDFMKNCDNKIYNAIRDHGTSLKEGTELKPAHIKCANCNNEYDQPYSINPTDFFG